MLTLFSLRSRWLGSHRNVAFVLWVSPRKAVRCERLNILLSSPLSHFSVSTTSHLWERIGDGGKTSHSSYFEGFIRRSPWEFIQLGCKLRVDEICSNKLLKSSFEDFLRNSFSLFCRMMSSDKSFPREPWSVELIRLQKLTSNWMFYYFPSQPLTTTGGPLTRRSLFEPLFQLLARQRKQTEKRKVSTRNGRNTFFPNEKLFDY